MRIVHRASTSAEVQALREAAEGARRVRPPGIVRVVDVDAADNADGSIVLTVVVDAPDGPTIAERTPLDPAAFRDLADALARLHAVGIAHGAVDAAQIRCDATGRAVLPLPVTGGSIDDDLAALRSLVRDRTARSAKEVATRLGTSRARTFGGGRRRRGGRTVAGALAVGVGFTLTVVSTMAPSGARPVRRARPQRAYPLATIPASTDPVVTVAGKRYRVGAVEGDLVIVGAWDCAATLSPALVRPGDGNVFVFEAFRPDLTTTPVTRLDGVVGAGRATDAEGCDRLVVDTARGPTTVVVRRRHVAATTDR